MRLFAIAESSKKPLGLAIFPGFFAPEWAKEGATTALFTIPYGPGAGRVEKLPLPWDEVYLNRWFGFLKQLGDRYGRSPVFRQIGAAGPTSVSTEMSLPDRPKDKDVQKWMDLSYRPSKYVAAWRATFQAYDRYFPNQYISLSFYPSLPINEQGKLDRAERTTQSIIEMGIGLLGGRMEFLICDLTGHPQVPGSSLMASYIGRVITGWVAGTSASANSKAMGAEGDAPLALRRTIDNGLKPNSDGKHVDFLVLYEADINAEEMQPVLKYGASLFGPPNRSAR